MLLSDGRSLALRCRMNLSRLSTWGRSFSAVVACAGRMSCTTSWVSAQLHQVDLIAGSCWHNLLSPLMLQRFWKP